MSFAKARSVDDIYEVARDYDRVITKDAPLADALNYRLDEPRLEKFARTPRGVVYDTKVDANLRDRRDLFLRVLRETDLGWKEAFFYLRQALNAWEETGELEKLSNYELFQSDDARDVIGLLGTVASVFRGMENYEPDYDGDVLVVQPDKLTPLDRHVLPEAYDTLEPLTDETYEPSSFNIYPSTSSLVQTVLDNVSDENARDVAVVVEPDSQYQPLLESAFLRHDVPFMYDRALTEDEHFRTLFRLMRAAFTRARLRVRDVMPLMHRMNLRVPLKFHDAYLSQYDHEVLDPFQDLLQRVPDATFGALLDRYEDLTGVELEAFRSVLENLNFLGVSISLERLNELEFYLSNFDRNLEDEGQDEGVLFASPRAGAYVDRPIVFYLGMDASWTRTVPERPWIDHDRQRSNNLTDFQVMLQNGEQQCYLVQEHRMNADVTPCFYFNVLFEEDFETFSDHDHRTMSGLPNLESGPGFDHEPREVDHDSRQAFSQSALNSFVESPREYFFDTLVPTTENVHMRKGQVFHDFAEFYVNHPDAVEESNRERFVDIMEAAMRDLADEFSRQDMRTEFEIGIDNIVRFLESEGYEAFEPAGYEPDRFDRGNVIARHFEDRAITSPISEAWFEDSNLGVRGLVDFIPREDTLVDFKSGRMRSRRKVVEQASPDRFDDDPDFQAILYLLHHHRRYPDRKLQFTFFHFLENLSDVLQGEGGLKDTLVTVDFYPRSFPEQVPMKDTFEYLTGGVSENNDRRKTLEGIEYDRFRRFFTENEFPDVVDKDRAEAEPITERFIAFCQEEFDDYNYVIDGAKSTIRKLVGFRQKNFFEGDLDRFRAFLTEQLERLETCYRTGFDVENAVEDLDLDELNHRDLIVDDRYE